MTFNKHHIYYALLTVLYLVIYCFIVRPENFKLKNRINELNQQNDSLALDIKAKQAQILELNSIAEKFKEEIEKDKAELEVLKEKSKQNKNKHDKERDRINNLDAKSVVSEFTDAFK